MSKPVDLDALEKLLSAATPGPWTLDGRAVECDDGEIAEVCGAASFATAQDDGRLIVAAVNALPALIAELRAARKLNERLRASLVRLVAEYGPGTDVPKRARAALTVPKGLCDD